MIERPRQLASLEQHMERSPIVAILGARQVGKTTLARNIAERHDAPVTSFDLERPRDLARLEDPELALEGLEGLVILDEIQRRPDLFPVLRVLVDRPEKPIRFLVLGSASPDLLRQSSETLAGRIAYHPLGGLSLDEVGIKKLHQLWLRGGFPRSFLAKSENQSFSWRRDFVQSFLERDLPQLGIQVPASALRRFWTMLAHYHGQTWNGSELGRALGVSHNTVRRYLDILESTFVVRVVKPWFENLKKRQVKAPKVYLSDSGLLHMLLGIRSTEQLLGHPKVGASWEGLMLGTVIELLGLRPEECYFWATHRGAELDLFVPLGGRRYGFEFKRTSAPRLTPSMRSALEDLSLDRLFVVHPGAEVFPLAENVQAVGADVLLDVLETDLPHS